MRRCFSAFLIGVIWELLYLTVILLLLTALGAFVATRARAASLRKSGTAIFASLPGQHGLLASTLALIAGMLGALATLFAGGGKGWMMPTVATAAGIIATLLILSQVSARLRARTIFETIVKFTLAASSAIAVLATVGIFASVVFETAAFFKQVNVLDFLFGIHWTPTGTPPTFGFVPLFTGTMLITCIALIVAAPLGLFAAIYLAEYASLSVRRVMKPVLELLVGVPTVVLGFFAALTVAPLVRSTAASFGLDVASESALAAGLVMGMMIVPLISSLSDDIINAVPQSLRDGSYAMGATKSETIKKVVLPAALPGIVSALMLAVSRAIGETMIVVMAAGLAANLSVNPLAAVTTITVQIASLLVGDQEFDSAKTLSAFALGFVLFFITLALNYVALRIVQRYRQAYE